MYNTISSLNKNFAITEGSKQKIDFSAIAKKLFNQERRKQEMSKPLLATVFNKVILDGWGNYQIDKLLQGAPLSRIFFWYGKDLKDLCFPQEELDWFCEKHDEKLNHGHRNLFLTEEFSGLYVVHIYLRDKLPTLVHKEKMEPGEFSPWLSGHRKYQIVVPEQ